jgi:methyltransferase
MTLASLVLALVTTERLAELALSRWNAARLLATGAVEHGQEHYPAIVGLHVAWLAGLWLVAWDRPVNLTWLFVYLAFEVLRAWVMATLGRRWTTRIIVPPSAPLVRSGPYRFLSHPNYVVVTAEVAVLPLVFGLPWYALVSSVVNAAVLAVRIRAENAALAPLRR